MESDTMNKDQIEQKSSSIMHKDNSLNRLDLSFLKHIELSEYKKSDLLAYWLNDFAEYHDEERTFDISKSGIYSRGDVIKVNLGFNIGNEFGGRHPAIILRKTADSIFVVPLSSQKPDSPQKYHVKIEKVYGFKNMERWTNVLRLQNVSIQRIDMTASIGNVKGTVLDAINDALKISHIF